MNYQKIHDNIINRAKLRQKPNCYTERHHIIPRSMGGNNSKDNIVILTAREHYLIHWLLYKIHKNQAMAFAWIAMTNKGHKTQRYNSKTFEYAKILKSKIMSAKFKSRKLTQELKDKLSKAKKGKTYKDLGRGESQLKGRKLSESHKRKLAEANIGRKWTDEQRKKMSNSVTGEGNSNYGKITPPHVRKKLSDSLKGKNVIKSPETLKKHRQTLLNNKLIIEKLLDEKRKRPIINYVKE